MQLASFQMFCARTCCSGGGKARNWGQSLNPRRVGTLELLPQGSAVGLGDVEAILKPLNLLVGVVQALPRLSLC